MVLPAARRHPARHHRIRLPHLTLAPSVVGDLTSASGRQRTARGTVESSWQRDGNTLTYHAVVPVGSTATIELPLLGGKRSVVREGAARSTRPVAPGSPLPA
ncbi:alpha-L-rhamnosidase C-terminal domain-containing protein [Streptomyces sp. M10(2022)]